MDGVHEHVVWAYRAASDREVSDATQSDSVQMAPVELSSPEDTVAAWTWLATHACALAQADAHGGKQACITWHGD